MEEFIRKIEDLYRRANERNIIVFTNFLTPAEQQIILSKLKVKVCFEGGNAESERKRAIFLPDYIDNIDVCDYISLIKAKFSFRELSHRDFLGAILSLGIKRECVGDIFVMQDSAYIFITKEMTKFVLENLNKVGSVGVKLKEVSLEEFVMPEAKTCDITFTVASLRFDSVGAGAFSISRESMNKNIRDGIANLNYLPCLNVSEDIKEGDILSVKGYGKVKIDKIGSLSKKGRIFVTVKKYI